MHRYETMCMKVEKTIKLDDGARQVSSLIETVGQVHNVKLVQEYCIT